MQECAFCAPDLTQTPLQYLKIQALRREIEAELMERIRAAVLLPVRIDVKDVYDETCTELRVTAALDSGGRGRPRVTYDVTAALANMGELMLPSLQTWCQFMCACKASLI